MEAKRASAGSRGEDRAETGGGGGGSRPRVPDVAVRVRVRSFGSFGSFGFASFGFGSFAAACSREDSAARAWSSRARELELASLEVSVEELGAVLARGLGTPVRVTTREERLGVHEGVHAAEERVVVVVVHELALEGGSEVGYLQVLQPLLRLVVHRGGCLCAFEGAASGLDGAHQTAQLGSSASVRCTMDEMRSVARPSGRGCAPAVARVHRRRAAGERARARRRCGRGDREVVDTDFPGRDRRSAALVSGIQNYSEASRVSGPAAPPGRGDGARLIPRASSQRVCVRAPAAPPSTVASDGSLGKASSEEPRPLALESPNGERVS